MFAEDVSFAVEELEKLVGYQIVGTTVTPGREFYGFIVQKDPHGEAVDKKTCWVDRDPEGNGPGWIQIEDYREP